MKFIKTGTRSDTFYTEEATRTVVSDMPSDLILRVNNISYLLHKLQFPLLPKCGILQQLCSDSGITECATINLHDVPDGEDALQLCTKYCYDVTINLSPHNFVKYCYGITHNLSAKYCYIITRYGTFDLSNCKNKGDIMLLFGLRVICKAATFPVDERVNGEESSQVVEDVLELENLHLRRFTEEKI